MKLFIVVVLSLVSSVAMADGFRCRGEAGYHVKEYNQVRPDRGTTNPAILVVSKKGAGTVAVLENDQIEKSLDDTTVSYSGIANGRVDGRFIYVQLDVERKPSVPLYDEDGNRLPDGHAALLSLTANGDMTQYKMVCTRYLKGARQGDNSSVQ